MSAPAQEQRLLRRAARRIALQLAAGTLLLISVVGSVVFVIDRSAARHQTDDLLRRAASSADDVIDPPAEVYLVVRAPTGQLSVSPDTPPAAASGALLGRPTGYSTYRSGGEQFRVLTQPRPDGGRIQALLDTQTTERERDRLLLALFAAGGFGVPLAAGVGLLLASRAIRPLADALALQRRFVTDASHELRAPLTLLHTRAQLLVRSTESGRTSGRRLAEQLSLLLRDTRAVGEVVEDLLLSAELRHQPAARRRVDLADLARDVVSSFTLLAAELQVSLRVVAGEAAVVAGAPSALRRAVSALLDNALGHVRPGDDVCVEVGADARSVRLTVTDSGVGLDPAKTDALLARFARGETAHTSGRRFGLGLALVSEVISAHDGQLLIDGAPGAGATFTIVLPLATMPSS